MVFAVMCRKKGNIMGNEFTPEQIGKVKAAKSPDELLSLARENGLELSEEQAKVYFEQMNKTGELSDDELDNVAGGACHTKDGRKVTYPGHGTGCSSWRCRACGFAANSADFDYPYHSYNCSAKIRRLDKSCKSCKYMTIESGLWICNNETINW